MIDLVLVAVVLVSALLGLMRGFVGILMSTAAWLLAGLTAFKFGADAALWLSDDGTPTAAETFGGYALSFIVVLLVVGLLGALVRSMVRASELSGADRAMGFGVGVARGLIIACVMVLALGFTPMAKEPSWRQSQVLPLLMPGVDWMRARLPEWPAPQASHVSGPASGDNGAIDGPSSNLMEGALRQVLQRSVTEAVAGGPVSVPGSDSLNVDNDQRSDPANLEAPRPDGASVEPPVPRSRSGQRAANVEPSAE